MSVLLLYRGKYMWVMGKKADELNRNVLGL